MDRDQCRNSQVTEVQSMEYSVTNVTSALLPQLSRLRDCLRRRIGKVAKARGCPVFTELLYS